MSPADTPRYRWLLLALATGLVAATLSTPGFLSATGPILDAGGATAVDGEFVVALTNVAAARNGVEASARSLAARYGGTIGHVYRHALHGFSVRLSAAAASRLAADPAVHYVQQNHTLHVAGVEAPSPSWGLDRLDQRTLPLDRTYTYPTLASNVRAYIIDTGIRLTHSEFAGRAVSGWDTVDDDSDATDCHGHGTHVAATVGGSRYGVAKGVTLVAVRVLDCEGSGSYADGIAGIDWVTGDHDPGEPAVANMSLGSMFNQATNDAVAASIADGVTYAVAAGNDFSMNACAVSPGSTPAAITVGATEPDGLRAKYSNIGPCIDVFAPGSGITSAWATSDTATNTISGTSMATPHATGVAALILGANPSFTPGQVRDALVADATYGAVRNAGVGSPNRLLHVNNGARAHSFSLALSPPLGPANPGDSISATVRTVTTVGGPQLVRLSAADLPAGTTARFTPSAVISGSSATLTVTPARWTPPGGYPLTILATSPSATQVTVYGLTVNTRPGCTAIGGDVAIPNMSTVESVVRISRCGRRTASVSTVEVFIVHGYVGDLVVTLVAPDGTSRMLHNATDGDMDNIQKTYTLDLTGERIAGDWKLRVRDSHLGDTGFIYSWTLNLGTGPRPPASRPSPSPDRSATPTGRP